MPDDNKPDQHILVTSLRQTRERLLKDLDERNGDLRETFKKLDKVEDLLGEYDPAFETPPRRLAFTKASGAAVILLLESGNQPMPMGELIELMLANGVCMGAKNPRASIKKSFSWKPVQKMFHFDKATGYVSIAKGYYQTQVGRKK